ncbi:hypothetical protein ND748_26495 [Frankia sp. AiPs1]|uniref:hypothetical protein n=1 Tax=Frankia sp. AiPs1 TaxID=573493 RepID=UPI002043F6A7|nr:hypothetical protein [Frankia sp. AiPs1]MCM3925203.1 hypothetical protein [Frankia sp. AiPs1]
MYVASRPSAPPWLVAILMTIARALAPAGPGRRPRAPARAAPVPPAGRPVRPPGRSGDGSHRFDQAAFEPLADRMSCLLRAFLAAAVPRPDRPARLDLRAPATTWFVDAFTAASDLLVGTSQADRPESLAAAVREAERRWGLIDAWSREAAEPLDDSPAPPGPVESGRPRPDDPDSADHRW